MSVHCIIAIQEKNGSLTGIYCHCDGYIDSVGEILYYHYRNVDKIRVLVSLGNIESLGKNVFQPESRHSFGDSETDVTIAYHRDKGQVFSQFKAENLKEFNRQCRKYSDISYIYLYIVNEGRWYVDDEPLKNFFKHDKNATIHAII